MSGETVNASAVFNLATQFGGGKTHALTMLYHLCRHGDQARRWQGVGQILSKAAIKVIPHAEIAVFVGTEFDSIAGRGGNDGSPQRFTPWGEIAYQLGGPAGFEIVREHDEKRVAPGGDVIRRFIPKGKPCLILIDELINYVSRFRKSGLSDQLYNFIMNLTGAIDSHSALVVAVPASMIEMTTEDHADYQRITKMLERTGRSVVMSDAVEDGRNHSQAPF